MHKRLYFKWLISSEIRTEKKNEREVAKMYEKHFVISQTSFALVMLKQIFAFGMKILQARRYSVCVYVCVLCEWPREQTNVIW